MRAATERTIWSISVSPDSRSSKPIIGPAAPRPAGGAGSGGGGTADARGAGTGTLATAGPGACAAIERACAAASASLTASAAAAAAAPNREVRGRVLVILPSQYDELCCQVYWHCTGFVT
jgi:hypothetical protein